MPRADLARSKDIIARGEQELHRTGQLARPTPWYWSDPKNIVKWHTQLEAQPEAEQSPFLRENADNIRAAYQYASFRNEGKPWWQWKPSYDDDPVFELYKTMGNPTPDEHKSLEILHPKSLVSPPPPGSKIPAVVAITGNKEFGQASEVAQPTTLQTMAANAPGAAMAGGMAAVATPGPIPAKLAAGALAAYGAASGKTAKSTTAFEDLAAKYNIPSITKALMVLDYAADFVEKLGGVEFMARQAIFNKDTDALVKLVTDLPTAFDAAHWAYDVGVGTPTGVIANLINPAGMIGALGGAMAQQVGGTVQEKLYERFPQLQPDATETQDQANAALWDIYDGLNQGKTVEDITAEVEEKYGMYGMGRDLVGHMVADPLNVFGIASAGALQGVGKIAGKIAKTDEAMKAAGILQRAAATSEDWVTGLQKYSVFLKSGIGGLGLDDVSRLDSISRTLAGVTKAGKATPWERFAYGVSEGGVYIPTVQQAAIKAGKLNRLGNAVMRAAPTTVIGYAVGGPIGAAVGAAFGGVSGYYRFLTPTARATEYVNNAALDIGRILAHADHMADENADEAVKLAQKWIRSLANNPAQLARELSMTTLNAPEASAVPMMLRSYEKTLDEQVRTWNATQKPRNVLGVIAKATGMDDDQVIGQIRDNQDHGALFATFVETAKQKKDSPEAQMFVEAAGTGAITADNLRTLNNLFVRDQRPYNYTLWEGEVFASLIDHADDWSVDWFGVKPDSTWVRTGKAIKSAQSAALLGLNPTYAVQNMINNAVTMAFTGVFGLHSTKQINAFWHGTMGLEPPRFRAGLGPAMTGDETLGMQYTKHIRRANQYTGKEAKGLIRDFNLAIEEIGSAAGRLTSYMPFTAISNQVEKLSSAMAYTTATMDAFARMKKVGKGINPLDPSFESELSQVDPGLPDLVYHAIAAGNNRQEIEAALFGGMSKRQVDSFIDDLGDEFGVSPGTLKSHLMTTGAYDFLKERLQGNYTRGAVDKTFGDLQGYMVNYFDDMVRQEIQTKAEWARDKISTEGVQSLVELVQRQQHDNLAQRFNSLAGWEWFWHDLEGKGLDRELRSEAIREQFSTNERTWRRQWVEWEAYWLGIANALGNESPSSRRLLGRVKELSDGWSEAHRMRTDLYRDHFNTQFDSYNERAAAWKQVKAQVRDVMNQAFEREQIATQDIGNEFAGLLEEYTTQKRGPEYATYVGGLAREWFGNVSNVLNGIYGEMRTHFDNLEGLPREERDAAWQRFNSEIRIPKFVEHWQAHTDGVVRIAEAFDSPEPPPAVMPTIPERPPAPPAPAPTAPTIAPAPTAAVPPAPVIEPAPVISPQRERMSDIMGIASEYGIPTAKDDGSPLPGALRHIDRVLKKYGDDPELGIDEATPDQVRAAFEKRAQGKDVEETVPPSVDEPAPEPEAKLVEELAPEPEIETVAPKPELTETEDAIRQAEEIQSWADNLQSDIDNYRAGESAASVQDMRIVLERGLREAFNLKDEEVDAVMRIADARALAWAKWNNKSPGDWYQSRIYGVKRGSIDDLIDDVPPPKDNVPDTVLPDAPLDEGPANQPAVADTEPAPVVAVEVAPPTTVEMKVATSPVTNKYFIATSDGYKWIKGKKVDVPGHPEYDLFAHKSGAYWNVSDGVTGLAVFNGQRDRVTDAATAVNSAISAMAEYADKFPKLIDDEIEKGNVSPRWRVPGDNYRYKAGQDVWYYDEVDSQYKQGVVIEYKKSDITGADIASVAREDGTNEFFLPNDLAPVASLSQLKKYALPSEKYDWTVGLSNGQKSSLASQLVEAAEQLKRYPLKGRAKIEAGTQYAGHKEPYTSPREDAFVIEPYPGSRMLIETAEQANNLFFVLTGKEIPGMEGTKTVSRAGGILFQNAAGPVWYSKAERAISRMADEKMTVGKLRNVLSGSGVSADELKWSGLEELMTERGNNGRITKSEALDYLNVNRVEVKEVLAESTSYKIGTEPVRYGNWVLPGGEYYRELLFTLPPNERTPKLSFTEAQINRMYGFSGEVYQSPHWSEPNVLAHVRFNERNGKNGERILFIEELQSDLHQKGKVKGYLPGAKERQSLRSENSRIEAERNSKLNEMEELQRRLVYLRAEKLRNDPLYTVFYDRQGKEIGRVRSNPGAERQWLVENYDRLGYLPERGYDIGDAPKELQERIDNAWRAMRTVEKEKELLDARLSEIYRTLYNSEAVPDMPFAKTWPDLVMKRMIRFAAEEGYDQIAWTTGEQQVQRYPIDVEWKKIGDDPYRDQWKVTGFSEGDEVFSHVIDGIEDLKRLKTTSDWSDKIWAAIQESPDEGIMQPLRPGMVGFYDVMLPGQVQKYIKKWGSSVGKTDIATRERAVYVREDAFQPGQFGIIDSNNGYWITDSDGGLLRFDSEKAAQEYNYTKLQDRTTVHSFDITPAMKESVMQGQPLFQYFNMDPKGAVSFTDDGKAIIYAFKQADVSTAVHELGHIFRRDLEQNDLDMISNWAGAKDGVWNEAAEEKFARAFERYLYEGRAPLPGLQGVFENFRRWLMRIYQSLTGSAIDVEITPELKYTFDKLFDSEVRRPEPKPRYEPMDTSLPVEPVTPRAAPEPEITRPIEAEQPGAPEPAIEGPRPLSEVVPSTPVEPEVSFPGASLGAVKIKTGLDQQNLTSRFVAQLFDNLGISERVTQDDFWAKIENDPFLDLSIETHGDQIYLAHYITDDYSHDTWIDSEMVFKFDREGNMRLVETSVQNPVTGGEARGLDPKFGQMFAKNLLDQGFGKGRLLDPRRPITTESREQKLISTLLNRLQNDELFENSGDFDRFAREMGFDIDNEKDVNLAYDLFEGAFNLRAREIRAQMKGALTHEVLMELDKLEGKLTKARRTISKMALQQFSTPLTISEAAGRVADVMPGDVVGEATAGTGNLVDRFMDMPEVEVRVNEIDPGRRLVLEHLGYKPTGIDVLSGDWLIAGDKPRGPWASVMIINPPWGSYSQGKYGKPMHVPVELNDWSQRFTYLIQKRLAAGGRLVIVAPTNWVYTMDRKTRAITTKRSAFVQWLEKNYQLQAIIESPPEAYAHRATDIGSLLVVVDNHDPDLSIKAIERWGELAPKNWEEYSVFVDKLTGYGDRHPNHRTQFSRSFQEIQGHGEDFIKPIEEPSDTGIYHPDAAFEGPGAGEEVPVRPGIEPGIGTAGVGGVAGRGTPDVSARPERPGEAGLPGPEPLPVETGGVSAGLVEEKPAPIPRTYERKPIPEPIQARIDNAKAAVRDSRIFTEYPRRSPLRDTDPYQPHPSLIVETKSLSGVRYPDLDEAYRPSERVIDAVSRRALSVEGNLDPIWAAVQQNDKHHRGLLVADDVGIGKSRTAAGFVLDRIERGKKNILVITKNPNLVDSLSNEEFPGVYNGIADEYGGYQSFNAGDYPARRLVISGDNFPKVKKGIEALPVSDEQTVWFISASQFADFGEALEKVKFDSIVVDEVHAFKNVGGTTRGEWWTTLHNKWLADNTDFLYLSATPGQDIDDLRYLYGLRLWRPDGFGDWVGMITGQISPEEMTKRAGAMDTIDNYLSMLQAARGEIITQQTTYTPPRGGDPLQGVAVGDFIVTPELAWRGQNFVIRSAADGHVLTSKETETEAIILANLINERFNTQLYQGLENENQRRGFLNQIAYQAEEYFDATYPRPGRSDLGVLNIRDATDIITRSEKGVFGKAKKSPFESTISPAHTEQIMREMKAGGSYMSRDISRVGVEFAVKGKALSPEAKARFDKRVGVYHAIYDAWRQFAKYNEDPKQKFASLFGVLGKFQQDAKRAQFDLRLPQIVEETKAALARGEKVVISTVSVSKTSTEHGALVSALDMINTNEVKKLGEGVYSDPAQIPEALMAVLKLREDIQELGELPSPIDVFQDTFGDGFAAIHGGVDAKDRKKISKAFQDNSLDVVMISGAGKEGINLHDTNGKKKVHLIVGDFEWSPTMFKQELGRVDRTGQKSSPAITVLHNETAAERKFVSTIANRMMGLGATSKGGAESTGVDALTDEFELGTTTDRIALATMWAGLPAQDKALFMDKFFLDPTVPGAFRATINTDGEAVKKVLLALQAMAVDDGNRIWHEFMKVREAVSDSNISIEDEARKTAAGTGKINRQTPLGDNLRLTEVVNQENERFGILDGILTPHMNKVKGAIRERGYYESDNLAWMKWVRFYDPEKQQHISGLRVIPSKISAVANAFSLKLGAIHTRETLISDLRSGDHVPVVGEELAEWNLYLGKAGNRDGKYIIDGAKMKNAQMLLRNGALMHPTGFFYIPEDKINAFLDRFPIRTDQLNQAGGWFETPTGRKRVLKRDGERILFQDTDGSRRGRKVEGQPQIALGEPMGTVDKLIPEPPTSRMAEESWNEFTWPMLRKMQEHMRGARADLPTGAVGKMTKNQQKQLRSYLGKVYGELADTKLGAIKWGENRRDFALLNYSRRYEWDNVLAAILPYQFFYTRTAMNWALRALGKPAILANYARMKETIRKINEQPGFPTRLKGKIKIPYPYMGNGTGPGWYIDPLRQLFPVDQLISPIERYHNQETLVERRAQYILQDWIAQEKMDPNDPSAAERALAQARVELEAEVNNPFDFMNTIISPSLPVQWGYNIARKTPNKIGQLPATRFVQSISALAGANQGRGWNIEGPLRRALGMPERGNTEDFLYDRELARMVAEGVTTLDQAQRAMMEKSGDAYLQAQQRVSKLGAVRNLAGFMALDAFPESEKHIRGLRDDYEQAIKEEYDEGKKGSINAFYDKYPEYAANSLMGDSPDDKMRYYLKGAIWEKYMDLPDLHKRQVREQFGKIFQDNFLNESTRSYNSIDTMTMAAWAKQLNGYVPSTAGTLPQANAMDLAGQAPTQSFQAYNDTIDKRFPGIYQEQEIYFSLPEGPAREKFLSLPKSRLGKFWDWKNRYYADHPEILPYVINENSEVFGAPPEIQQAYYDYKATQAEQFPEFYEQQSEYFGLDKKGKKAYLTEHPELGAAWTWQRTFMANFPQLIPYIRSTESIARDVLGDDYKEKYGIFEPVDISGMPPALMEQVVAHYNMGLTLGSGVNTWLNRMWKDSGSSKPYKQWIEEDLQYTLMGVY